MAQGDSGMGGITRAVFPFGLSALNGRGIDVDFAAGDTGTSQGIFLMT